MIREKNYTSAFHIVLSAQDLRLVEWACEETRKEAVNVCKSLEPMALLSLMQQLASAVTNKLSLKLWWLQVAASNLDLSDAEIHNIGMKLLSEYIIPDLEAAAVSEDHQLHHSFSMVLMLYQGLK